MKEILVETLMSRDVQHLSQQSSVEDVLALMNTNTQSCIVIAEQGKPLGIVTERDIVRLLHQSPAKSDLFILPATQVMSSPIVSLHYQQSLFDALVISRANHIRHFPVIDDQEQLVGLITHTDLANAHFKVVELQSEIIEATVQSKTQALEQANHELLALSLEDHLLQIGNRRAMEVDLQHTHAAATRYNQTYSVIIMDLDYFKNFNDHYGHTEGDRALKTVAQVIKKGVRESDRLYRYGGEELLLLLPATALPQAGMLAKKLVGLLANEEIPHAASPFEILTISAGAACFSHQDSNYKSWQQTVTRADELLYQAKSEGRNRAVCSN